MTRCTRCGLIPGKDDSQVDTFPGHNRPDLRSRISELDVLIASLLAERQRLQAESDAIVYPVLSIPPEVTTEIFFRCLPCESNPRPSPTQAPLLLAQICRQWRQIALHTPALWRCLVFGDEMPVELFHIWLSRSGSLPLSLQCRDASEAGALIEASLAHSHHWGEIKFTMPLTSMPKLALHHASLPMLRSISIDIPWWPDEPTPERLIIEDAPLLREAHIFTFPHVKIDLPWSQITTLTLLHDADLTECISLLRGCQDLVNLTVRTLGPATAHTDVLTLRSLEALICNFGESPILEFLTTPRLKRLTFTDIGGPPHVTVLKNLIRRSACPLTFFSLSGDELEVDTLTPSLFALPDSVSELELIAITSRLDFSQYLLTAFQSSDLLPRLSTLQLRVPRRSAYVPQTLIDLLHMRLQESPSRVTLKSFPLHISAQRHSAHMPSSSALAQLRALASAGLDIKFTVSGRGTTTRSIL